MSQIICGDSREKLKDIPADTIDCGCTDPPYSWGFMGKNWDAALPPSAIWDEYFRVLKPGAVAFVMCGARTDSLWRMGRDLEQAGFDVSLQPVLWCYNQGFPKALDIGKSFDKAAFRSWAKPLMDDMGWGNAELRKAASAAVNGQYRPADGRKHRERGDAAYFGSGFDGQINTNDEGTRLLAALVAKHWEPLEDLQKLDVWKDHSVLALREYQQQEFAIGPDHQDLSLPPGVRVKVGEQTESGYPDGDGIAHYKNRSQSEDSQVATGGTVTLTAPSVDLAKQWDGYKSQTGLKPAYEFVIVARKPLDKSPIRDNVAEYGTGAYHIDAARVPFSENSDDDVDFDAQQRQSAQAAVDVGGAKPGDTVPKWKQESRFPPNLISSGGAMGEDNRYYDLDRWAQEHGFAEDETWLACAEAGLIRVPKPSKKEKEAGCGGLSKHQSTPRQCVLPRKCVNCDNWILTNAAQRRPNSVCTCGNPQPAEAAKLKPRHNNHPCVKPVSLFAWLLALGCPEGGTVLDPFAGSGTTGVAAAKLGMDYILIDQDEHYTSIARARVAHAEQEARQGRLL